MAAAPCVEDDGALPGLASLGRLALSKCEAADALGFSVDFFEEHVMHELRVARRGRRRDSGPRARALAGRQRVVRARSVWRPGRFREARPQEAGMNRKIPGSWDDGDLPG